MENPCEAVKTGKQNSESWQCCIKEINIKESVLKRIALKVSVGG